MGKFAINSIMWLTLGAGFVACGGDALTLPADGSPSRLQAISGGGQQATVGTELPDPLRVRLTDAVARPVSGVALSFRFQSEVQGAELSPATIETDDSGFADVTVRLGTTVGDQGIEARLAANPNSQLSATFTVTALAEEHGNGNGGGGKGKGKGRGHANDDEE
jgi:hypothetical protein